LKEPNAIHDAGHGLLDAGLAYARGDVRGVISAGTSLLRRFTRTKEEREKSRIAKTSPADVIQFSGCKDYQTAADTSEAVFPPI
jgi:metacaspase-1